MDQNIVARITTVHRKTIKWNYYTYQSKNYYGIIRSRAINMKNRITFMRKLTKIIDLLKLNAVTYKNHLHS